MFWAVKDQRLMRHGQHKTSKQTTTYIIKIRTSFNKFLVLRSSWDNLPITHTEILTKLTAFLKLVNWLWVHQNLLCKFLFIPLCVVLPGNLSLTPRRHFSLICIGCGVLFQSTFQRLPLLPPYWPSANIKSPYMAWNRKIDANQTQ